MFWHPWILWNCQQKRCCTCLAHTDCKRSAWILNHPSQTQWIHGDSWQSNFTRSPVVCPSNVGTCSFLPGLVSIRDLVSSGACPWLWSGGLFSQNHVEQKCCGYWLQRVLIVLMIITTSQSWKKVYPDLEKLPNKAPGSFRTLYRESQVRQEWFM